MMLEVAVLTALVIHAAASPAFNCTRPLRPLPGMNCADFGTECFTSNVCDYGTANGTAVAFFSLGCFWGGQVDFGCLEGVLRTNVGYMGGPARLIRPVYESEDPALYYASDVNQHSETVLVEYNTTQTNFTALVDAFYPLHDSIYNYTTNWNLTNTHYAYESKIFFLTSAERDIATASVNRVAKALSPTQIFVTVEGVADTHYWPAEDYHQYYDAKQGSRCPGGAYPK